MLRAIEIDAKQRAERRKKKQKIADELKEKGNIEFKVGNYEKAADYYKEVSLHKIQTVKTSLRVVDCELA